MKMNIEKISWEVHDEIGHFILDDSPGNIMTKQFFMDFQTVIKKIFPSSKVRGIVVYGRGRSFSSGAHITELTDNIGSRVLVEEDNTVGAYPVWFIETKRAFSFLEELDIPVIGALTGICYGSGFELALCCHIRVCGNKTLLSLPESTFDFLPGCGGTFRLPALSGLGKATELILTGESINADEALDLGIVDLVVDKKETINEAVKLMNYILCQNKPYSKSESSKYIKDYKNTLQEQEN